GDEWRYAVAGIGININQTQFANGLGNPVSLKQITGKENDPLFLAQELCKTLEKRFRQLLETPHQITADYNRYLYKKNQRVRFRNGSREFETTICQVTADGTLITKDSEKGAESLHRLGDLEWIH